VFPTYSLLGYCKYYAREVDREKFLLRIPWEEREEGLDPLKLE
jgi:hypothetical protein